MVLKINHAVHRLLDLERRDFDNHLLSSQHSQTIHHQMV